LVKTRKLIITIKKVCQIKKKKVRYQQKKYLGDKSFTNEN